MEQAFGYKSDGTNACTIHLSLIILNVKFLKASIEEKDEVPHSRKTANLKRTKTIPSARQVTNYRADEMGSQSGGVDLPK